MSSQMPRKGCSIKKKLALLFIGFSLITTCIVGAVSYWFAKDLSATCALSLESPAVDTLNTANILFLNVRRSLPVLSIESVLSELSGGTPATAVASESQVLSEHRGKKKEGSAGRDLMEEI